MDSFDQLLSSPAGRKIDSELLIEIVQAQRAGNPAARFAVIFKTSADFHPDDVTEAEDLQRLSAQSYAAKFNAESLGRLLRDDRVVYAKAVEYFSPCGPAKNL